MIGKSSVAKAKDMLRAGPAWATAVLATTAIASMVHSWQTQSSLISFGTQLSPGAALQLALHDVSGQIIPMLLVLSAALLLAFWAASWLKQRLPVMTAIVWPTAGAVAVGCTLGVMSAQLRSAPVTGALGADGFAMFCVAGALGGFVFSWLKPE